MLGSVKGNAAEFQVISECPETTLRRKQGIRLCAMQGTRRVRMPTLPPTIALTLPQQCEPRNDGAGICMSRLLPAKSREKRQLARVSRHKGGFAFDLTHFRLNGKG